MTSKSIKPTLISIVGPTAVGKTDLSIQLAQELGTVILSADSRQFYRELSIGTAKPSPEELQEVKHYFIDSHSINQLYSAGEYADDANALLKELFERHEYVIAVGGSSLYLKALWEGFDEIPKVDPVLRSQLNEEFEAQGLAPLLEELRNSDPEYFEQVDQKNGQRVIRALEIIRGTGQKFSSFRTSSLRPTFYSNIKIGLDRERDILFDRINKRMDQMLAEGLFQEAESFYQFKNHNALQTVGYSEIFDFLDGKYDREEMVRLLKRNSRRYAKRQLTWFRKYEDIHWFDLGTEDQILEKIKMIITSI